MSSDKATKRERPIIFSGPMVRAILAGTKTATRRPIKDPPPDDISPLQCGQYHPTKIARDGEEYPGSEIFGAYSDDGEWGARCPYGGPGDTLWVRETFRYCRSRWGGNGHLTRTGYRADDHEITIDLSASQLGGSDPRGDWTRWRPSIYMPRWASRITLEVTGVRVERLQEISDNDVLAEGIDRGDNLIDRWGLTRGLIGYEVLRPLWDAINAKRGFGWKVNPWVWVVDFRRIENGR